MKKLVTRLSFLISFLMISNGNFAQCPPPGDLLFWDQSQLDNFKILYPFCEEINGSVTISGADIKWLTGFSNIRRINGDFGISYTEVTNLSDLNSLEQITGEFWILGNMRLTNFVGLTHLIFVGSLYIEGNSLVNLTGIESLSTISNTLTIKSNLDLLVVEGLTGLISVGQHVRIDNNPLLFTLNGLRNLNFIGVDLSVWNSPSLHTLVGLDNVTHIKNLDISFNDNMNSLNGLWGLSEIDNTIMLVSNGRLANINAINEVNVSAPDQLILQFNSMLSNCSIESICRRITHFNVVDIHDNLHNCNSQEEVVARCNEGRSRKSDQPEEEISVYPNPNYGYFYVEGIDHMPTAILEIFSTEGKFLLRQNLKENAQIDIKSLPSGLYTLKIINESSNDIIKIIKN